MNTGFEFKKLDLNGAYLIHNFNVSDVRGGFTKSFEKDIFKQEGIDFNLNETFFSCSKKKCYKRLTFSNS